MKDFMYYAPTKVYFGRDADNNIGEKLKEFNVNKALVLYGGGSAVRSGLIAKVEKGLSDSNTPFITKGGVEPNPKLSFVRDTAELCKSENVDFILAVGGGSVIDAAKSTAIAVGTGCDPWDVIMGKVKPTAALPLASVLTIAAAGSEMSNSHVITNMEANIKKGCNCDLVRPKVAFMNPENTFTVPSYHTSCGVVDIMMHTFERYYTGDAWIEPTDRIAEAILLTVKEAGAILVNDPENYEARANLMWASSLSHNGLTACGKDFRVLTVHQLEHGLSGVFDRVAHGAGLAVLYPAWAKYVYKYDIPRFSRIAEKVWGVKADTPEETARLGVEAMKDYFASIGMPVSLKELDVTFEDFERVVNNITLNGERKIHSYIPLGKDEVMDIFKIAE
ncbi:MAG: iron-containing alcohol dehydrogenase [Ruminococcaceae bacterium]|nr:iron-containing alcohol dehydrogenase [Oscillospiraceae bacterium]